MLIFCHIPLGKSQPKGKKTGCRVGPRFSSLSGPTKPMPVGQFTPEHFVNGRVCFKRGLKRFQHRTLLVSLALKKAMSNCQVDKVLLNMPILLSLSCFKIAPCSSMIRMTLNLRESKGRVAETLPNLGATARSRVVLSSERAGLVMLARTRD